MSKNVPPRGDIVPHELPEPVGRHRVDYWTWVEKNADPASRDTLVVLRDYWRDCNTKFFGSIMLEPYITLTEPSSPQRYGQCCLLSSWGSRLEIRLRPSLLTGTHPRLEEGTEFAAGRMQFVMDVLLHESIHQHVMEHQPGVHEDTYHGHGPVFTDHCNRIGAELGLAAVVARNRNGEKKPLSAQWPHCVAEPDRYGGAYHPHEKRVTATRVTIPPGYRASSIAPLLGSSLEIGFYPASGDGSPVYVVIDDDAADGLANLIMAHFDANEAAAQHQDVLPNTHQPINRVAPLLPGWPRRPDE